MKQAQPTVIELDPRFRFPDPRLAADHGLVAIGGDYRPERLIAAYAQGIFPWPSPELPFAWFSPDPRLVLAPHDLHISRSLRRLLARGAFEIRFDSAFDQVVEACAAQRRPGAPGGGDEGTWITDELIEAFGALHRRGIAHSVEAWHDDRLVGGLYGLSLGRMFCGESMFYRRTGASKVALAVLARRLASWRFAMLDCQVHSEHLVGFGARLWRRDRFLDTLENALRLPTRLGPWPPPTRAELDPSRRLPGFPPDEAAR